MSAASPPVSPDTREILDRLVGFDTTSRASNLALIAYVETLLDACGASYERIYDATGTKANLIARIGPDIHGGVVLNGHTDCVPVDGQPWDSDPFTVVERDDTLVGRGVTDMKGFLAVVLAALPQMAAADLTRPIQLVLTYDEEIGTVGAPSAVETLVSRHPRPRAVIVGEPSSMEPVVAHKGVRAFVTSVAGLDAHSSQPHRAANAVAALARIATFIDELAAEYRAGDYDERFNPPHTTFNLGTFHGGTAVNIVARHAQLSWEYRPVPSDDSFAIRDRIIDFATADVLPRLREATGVGDISFEVVAAARGLDSEVDGAAEQLVRHLTGIDAPGRTVSFATDGGHFQAAGLSTVVVGPGSIDQAHLPNEWIRCDQLAAAESFVTALIKHLSA